MSQIARASAAAMPSPVLNVGPLQTDRNDTACGGSELPAETDDLPVYRAFPLNSVGAISGPSIFIEALNDQHAVQQANAFATTSSYALWNSSRLITHVEQRVRKSEERFE